MRASASLSVLRVRGRARRRCCTSRSLAWPSSSRSTLRRPPGCSSTSARCAATTLGPRHHPRTARSAALCPRLHRRLALDLRSTSPLVLRRSASPSHPSPSPSSFGPLSSSSSSAASARAPRSASAGACTPPERGRGAEVDGLGRARGRPPQTFRGLPRPCAVFRDRPEARAHRPPPLTQVRLSGGQPRAAAAAPAAQPPHAAVAVPHFDRPLPGRGRQLGLPLDLAHAQQPAHRAPRRAPRPAPTPLAMHPLGPPRTLPHRL